MNQQSDPIERTQGQHKKSEVPEPQPFALNQINEPSSPPPEATFPNIYGRYLAFRTVSFGDWTVGRLSLADDGQFVLRLTENVRLPDVAMPWYPSKIDFLDLPSHPDTNTSDEL